MTRRGDDQEENMAWREGDMAQLLLLMVLKYL